MAKETMAGKKKAQRVGKAKGLHDDVGSYGNKKSLNLRKKQLGKKGVAASKKRTVSISKTEHMKEGPNKGKVVGPKGNLLTGKVDMGGGNMAVYRNGKRVTAKSSKGVKPKVTSSKVTSSKVTSLKETPPKAKTSTLTAAQKAAKAKTTTLTTAQKAAARKGSGSSAGASAGARKVSDNSSGQSRVAAGRKTGTTKTGNGKKWYEQGGGGLTGSNSPSLEGFLKPGKNAPKMPKYTSSKYKWKG